MGEKINITVNEGRIRGFKAKSAYTGEEYYSFLGVPYGQPITNRVRFKDPVKVKPWSTTLDTKTEKDGCIQFSLHKQKIIGSEDCLYNNIYIPKIPSKDDPLKAVIVNIHPGGFFHGSPDPSHYGAPDFIIHRDIVYVCVAYRLHVLGFLNLNLKDCAGNQCLKDIILSLQWIKENISSFGGDPDNVTLMGSSSGSAIVHYLMLSPLANGLYHKAILMGMYVFTPVTVVSSENATVSYDLACKIGYDGAKEDTKKLLRFYQELDLVKYFAARPDKLHLNTTLQVFPASSLLPTVDRNKNSPIPLEFRELIPTTNRVPLLIGFCDREAAMAIGITSALNLSIAEKFRKSIRQNYMGWGANLRDDELNIIQQQVESFYLNGKRMEMASQSTLCDIVTDAALSEVYDSLINVISTDLPSSVFVYNFKYDGKLCTMKAKLQRMLKEPLPGAFHAADYSYWCYIKETAGTNCQNIHPNDRKTIDTLTNLFTTFAKTGNPNYEGMESNWKPSTPEQPSHLVINKELESRDELLNGQRMEFWHNLKKQFKK